ncbi:hypothetical protein V1507DRAFT_454493 [Lipomyces tetrasporus]
MFPLYDDYLYSTHIMTDLTGAPLADSLADSVDDAYPIIIGHYPSLTSDVTMIAGGPSSIFLSPIQPHSTHLRPHSYSEPCYLSRRGLGIVGAESDYSDEESGQKTYMTYSDYEQDLSVHLEPPTTTSQLRRSHSMYIALAGQRMYSPATVSPTLSHMSFDGQESAVPLSADSPSFNLADSEQAVPLGWDMSVPPGQMLVQPAEPSMIPQHQASPHVQSGMIEYSLINGPESPIMHMVFGEQQPASLPEAQSSMMATDPSSHPVMIISSPPYSPQQYSSLLPPPHSTSIHVDRALQRATPPQENQDVDRNGRRRRVYTKTQFTCSHCPRKFSITDIEIYCRHVVENNIQREFKCPERTCPWHTIGFQRKLEKDRHYTRKHGVPQYECRFWAGPGKEMFEGAGVCTTRWHADAGNRTRHERSIHGYYVATQRGRASSLDEVEMVKVDKNMKR